METVAKPLVCPFCRAQLATCDEPLVFVRVRMILHIERCAMRGSLVLNEAVLKSIDDTITCWITGGIDRRLLDRVTFGCEPTPAELLDLPD